VLQSQLQGRSHVMCSRLAAMEQGLKQVRIKCKHVRHNHSGIAHHERTPT
jgi:hypothetical protein